MIFSVRFYAYMFAPQPHLTQGDFAVVMTHIDPNDYGKKFYVTVRMAQGDVYTGKAHSIQFCVVRIFKFYCIQGASSACIRYSAYMGPPITLYWSFGLHMPMTFAIHSGP